MIQANKLFKTFHEGKKNEHSPVKSASFRIDSGECILLTGASGSGKTTLLSLLSLLAKPSSGQLLFGQEEVSKWSEHHLATFRQQHIGIVFQHFNLLEDLTAAENIALPLLPLGITGKKLQKMVEKAAERTNITNKLNDKCKFFSGGEMQRVAIARALVNEPMYIFADEPTAHLDSNNSLMIINTLRSIQLENSIMVITTHDPVFKENKIHSREILMKDGQIFNV